MYLPPLQGRGRALCGFRVQAAAIAAPARAGEGSFANEEFARADRQNISSRQTVSGNPNDHEKIYIFGKKCIISAFFLQLSAKKNNKDYIKTLDTEQNADYTIMDWVYWLFNASLSKYHQEEKT